MEDIFISYKVDDRATAIKYYHQLKSFGFTPWFDQLIPKDVLWDKAIERHISKADLVLCLLSSAVLKDDWVYHQIELAEKYHKKIIYLFLEDIDRKKFKKYNINQYYEKFEDIDWNEWIEKKLYLEYQRVKKEARIGQLRGYFLSFILALISSYILCYGWGFLNLHLPYYFGFIPLFVLLQLVISYVPNRVSYLINGFLSMSFLLITIVVYPQYYISGIPINSIFYLILLSITVFFRYLQLKSFIGFLEEILWLVLLNVVSISTLILFAYLLDWNVSSLVMIFLSIYLYYWYNKLNSYFDAVKKYKALK